MKKRLLFSVFMFISILGYSQEYSYSFEGSVSTDQISKIEARCAAMPEVKSVKIKYKDDRKAGEIIVFIEPNLKRAESRTMFKATELKQLLQSYGVTPLEFRELKSK